MNRFRQNNYYRYLLFIIINIFFFIWIQIAEWCTYQGEIDACKAANLTWNVNSIEDYVCIMWTDEEVAFQVTLDMDFKDLDDEMDSYIEELEDNKNKYFGIEREKNFIDWINDIQEKSAYFYWEYKAICWIEIIKKVRECIPEQKTSIRNSKKFFDEYDCMTLVEQKMDIFDDITFSILMLNKKQVKTDEKKKYDQLENDNYNKLIEILRINIWYIERIWSKIPSITETPHK